MIAGFASKVKFYEIQLTLLHKLWYSYNFMCTHKLYMVNPIMVNDLCHKIG